MVCTKGTRTLSDTIQTTCWNSVQIHKDVFLLLMLWHTEALGRYLLQPSAPLFACSSTMISSQANLALRHWINATDHKR